MDIIIASIDKFTDNKGPNVEVGLGVVYCE